MVFLGEMAANGQASAASHQQERQPLKMTLNFGSWAGRLHAVLGRAMQARCLDQLLDPLR